MTLDASEVAALFREFGQRTPCRTLVVRRSDRHGLALERCAYDFGGANRRRNSAQYRGAS